jgi:solute carrier family 25 phosphate transporter 3
MPSLAEVSKSNPFSKPVVADKAVEFGSTEYYLKCAFGGAISCGATHTLIVPLDLVKCRMQVDSVKYPNLPQAFKVK